MNYTPCNIYWKLALHVLSCSDKDHVWSRLLDRSQNGCQQTQPKNPACRATTRQESAKEIGCLKAESRQQETSFHHWYLQPFICSATQFRGPRRKLDSLSKHGSFFTCRHPRTYILQTPRLVWWARGFLKKNTACTRHINMILAQYPKRQLRDNPEQTRGHARFLAEQESGRNPVLWRQKEHEEVPWRTTDSLWSKEFWNHPTS